MQLILNLDSPDTIINEAEYPPAILMFVFMFSVES